ncbi:hypothetical protein F7725_011243 [Dissostichus mawsoni]|uniref:Uncharacterized protein n=1 Tax=Dissostichus mawsoni TaxID=36200 RepID=A0A7J5Z8A2_DISMA|nr:hypothetical protein F7725_011243 [Dissostichus mawsoni]
MHLVDGPPGFSSTEKTPLERGRPSPRCEADQKIENFSHHHACVSLPEDLCNLKRLKDIKGLEEYKNSVS